MLTPAGVPLAAGEEARAGPAVGASPPPDAAAAGLYAQPVLVLDPGMHTAMINRADLDRAGRLAVTGSHDKTVRLWALDGDLAEPLATWRMPAGPGNLGKNYAVAMAPAGDLIAAGGWTKGVAGQENIYLLTRDGRLAQRIGGLPKVVLHLAFSPDDGALAVDGGALRGALAGLANVTVLTSSSSAAPSLEHEDWQNGASPRCCWGRWARTPTPIRTA